MTEAEWLTCTQPEPMLEFFRGREDNRKLRLIACACCRRIWDLLVDERSKHALQSVEQHIEGKATDDQLRAAGSAAEQAFQDLRYRVMAERVGSELAQRARMQPRGLFDLTDAATALAAHHAADEDSAVLAASAVWSATVLESELQPDSYTFVNTAISAANQAAAATSDHSQEELAQVSIVHDIFGNAFRPIQFLPGWQSNHALSLARAMYESRDFASILALADMLQQSGCSDPTILSHCRSSKLHVRGCWVVDLMLANS